MANLAELQTSTACATCALGPLCATRPGRGGDEPSPVECRQRVAPGEALFAAGSPAGAVYGVRAGFLKMSCADGAGGRHIVRFLIPGDIAGLDAFSGSHSCEAVALADTEVCMIPTWRLEMLADYDGRSRLTLRQLMAGELSEAHEHSAAIARLTATQRVAHFLLTLSRRWSERGFSPTAFRLPMQRREIGEHLGLTMETVSRILSDFKARGWVKLPPHAIEILAPQPLRDLLEAAP
jgi:CRP/FNR family transcriptional regulator